jgi:toxin ParE1/3/4
LHLARSDIARDNPHAAAIVLDRIIEVAEFATANPGVGRATLSQGLRAFPVAPFPYVIYFRRLRGGVRIVRVLHSARRRPELREDGPAYLAEFAQARGWTRRHPLREPMLIHRRCESEGGEIIPDD